MVQLHPENVGKVISSNGIQSAISSVSASGEYFRLESQKNGPLIYDYRFDEIVGCEDLVVKFKEPNWVKVSMNPVNV